MKKLNHNVLNASGTAAKVWAAALSLSLTAVLQAAPVNTVPGRLLVKPAGGVSKAELHRLFQRHNAEQTDNIAAIDVRILKVPEAARDRVLEALQHNPNIEFAELDGIVAPDFVPNDPWFPNEWHLTKIQARQAWDITKGSSSVIVAILDTGVDATHPDLAPNLVPGWNFYDNNANTSDVAGHGTPVAGTVAAAGNNALGVASVAFNCRLMPIRVSDATGNANFSTIANALTYAADHGARVANISYKASDSSTITSAAQYFQSKGGVTSVSAGNDGAFDSAKDNPYLLTVGATTADDILTSWSCTGNNTDLVAPGQGIMTTFRGGGYGNAAGTSVSAPIVAAAAALVISVNPNLSGSQAQEILKQTADDLGTSGWDPSYGSGRVNAYKAVLAATGGTSTPPVDGTPPTANITTPSGSSILSGTATISVTASDNVGVTKVECYINGVLAASTAAAPYSFSWNTTTYVNGSYTLQAKAYDAAGNAGTSATTTVSVQNSLADTTAPRATLTAPASGSTVSGVVSVGISATDNVAVTKVEWYLNGVLAGSSSSGTATFSWNTASSPNGLCSLQARAYDAAGNIGSSSTMSVTVQNVADTTAPTVQITSPTSGAALARTTKVYVTALDNVAVKRVDLLVDGRLYSTSSSTAPVFSLNTSKISRGSHTLQSVAYDPAGNTGRSAAVTVNK